MTNYIYKIASSASEYEQIHRLNHDVFATEIAQHQAREDLRLVDQFDSENTYIICKEGDDLVGMFAIRDQRPFSVDFKLKNLGKPELEEYLPAAKRMCEIRLLSIKDCYRKTRILVGLLCKGYEYLEQKDYDLYIISGIIEQQKLYLRMGFKKFGPISGKGRASFQLMYLTRTDSLKQLKPMLLQKISVLQDTPANYLPGPVAISADTLQSLAQTPVSHRSDEFDELLRSVEQQLGKLLKCDRVAILSGGGTLANEFVIAHLASYFNKGVIINNGEFGQRLVNQAQQQGLVFSELRQDWGVGVDLNALEALLKKESPEWLLLTHCETSTGVLNKLIDIQTIAQRYNTRLCLDCVSTAGVVDIDLSNIYLATASSGKGLASVPGLSLIFYNDSLRRELLSSELKLQDRPCSSFDLRNYIDQQVPCTLSSNQLAALNVSLGSRDWVKQISWTETVSSGVRSLLIQMGYSIVAPKMDANPAVLTIALPMTLDSRKFGDSLKRSGFAISYESRYLVQRNWIQVCFMGDAIWLSHYPLLSKFKSMSNKKGSEPFIAGIPNAC